MPVGRHIKTYTSVANVEDCKVLCEKDPACKSIEYHPISKYCKINDADTSSVKIITPCSGFQYFEHIIGMVLCFPFFWLKYYTIFSETID